MRKTLLFCMAGAIVSLSAVGADAVPEMPMRISASSGELTASTALFPDYYPFPGGSTGRLEWMPEKCEMDNGLPFRYTFFYDADLRLTEILTECDYWDMWPAETRVRYVYDGQGRITTIFNTCAGEPDGGWILTYDEKCPEVITSMIGFDGSEINQAAPGYGSTKTVIVRDEAGNVTEVTDYEATRFTGDDLWEPTDRCVITYGPDHLPATIVEEEYDDDINAWTEPVTLTDIVWLECDGQIFSIDDVYSGGNRISSGNISMEGTTMPFSIEYTGDDTYAVTFTGTESGIPYTGVQEYTRLPVPGSYRSVSTMTMSFMGVEMKMVETEVLEYDAFGNLLEEYDAFSGDGTDEIYEWKKGELTYDAQGRPATYTLSEYDEDTDTWETDKTVVYNAWLQGAGVSGTGIAGDGMPEFYGLDGMRLRNRPDRGLYIERRDGKPARVMMK